MLHQRLLWFLLVSMNSQPQFPGAEAEVREVRLVCLVRAGQQANRVGQDDPDGQPQRVVGRPGPVPADASGPRPPLLEAHDSGA